MLCLHVGDERIEAHLSQNFYYLQLQLCYRIVVVAVVVGIVIIVAVIVIALLLLLSFGKAYYSGFWRN
jgi:hypothetical protein